MSQAFREEFVKVADLVNAADIPAASGRTVLWCIGQLPPLYEQLCETYETRFSDKIVQLEQGILGELAKEAKTHPDANRLAADIVERLRELHDRQGLQSLNPKPAKVAKVAKPAKSAGKK